MYRRNFIKSVVCLGCVGTLASGCKDILNFDDIKNDKFYYKSKADLPKKIRLEVCSLCQLKCPACSTRMLEKDAPKDWLGYLKFEDFKKFVDDNDFKQMYISNAGEIFLNPELDEIIKYAYLKNIKLDASVNLNSVSKTTLENLVKYQFRNLTVSIDGATPQTYKIYRRGGDFNRVIENIKIINSFKEKYGSEYPKLTWQFIVFGHNEGEIELAKKKADELNMQISFKKNNVPSYSPVKNIKLIEEQTGLKIDNTNSTLIKERIIKHKHSDCHVLFNNPQIDYDGTLLGCYYTGLRNYGVNVFKTGLLNALNSPDFIYAKHMLTDLSYKAKNNIPCAYCLRYDILKKENKPLIIS